MLWHKAWLETRWRFLIGVGLATCSAAGVVLVYPRVVQLLPMAAGADVSGDLGRKIREVVELSREYRGYIWTQAFCQNLSNLGTLFAVLLGTGGLLSGRAALFTLSLPVSRPQLVGVRAAAGLLEWLGVALVPSIVIPLVSPSIGESYAVGAALAHGVCLFAGGAIFFGLALLLSTLFDDIWRPLLIALGVAMVLAFIEHAVSMPAVGPFALMHGETYFRTGSLPWAGLALSAAASGGLIYGAALSLEQRDF